MKQITAFQTSDGQIFENEVLATQHEAKFNLNKRLSTMIYQFNIKEDTRLDIGTVIEFVNSNFDELCELIKK